ncbi:MAG: helix-turn-helix domain-containing protein [Defluviitaleaceae bacterium]|nr:helix-turn-helix domain-containing protein [Defluviitaleaceae bacterium]
MNRRYIKTNIDKAIGKNIEKERTSRNMSRDELAEIMGLTASNLGLIERGERGVTMVNLTKFIKTFDIPAEVLVGGPSMSEKPKDDIHETIGFKNRKKLRSLISSFSDAEVALLIHVIKGIQTYASSEICMQEGS